MHAYRCTHAAFSLSRPPLRFLRLASNSPFRRFPCRPGIGLLLVLAHVMAVYTIPHGPRASS